MRGDRYSRLVGWLKILLPLAALALLSTMFLFARRPGPTGDIPYAEIEDIASDPRVSAPAFAGVTPDGAAISLTAATIRPDTANPDSFGITALRIALTAADGETVTITAAEGAFDGAARQAVLAGPVRVEASSGYAVEAGGLTADLGAGTVATTGGLVVAAPFGELTAGGLALEQGGERMVFNGGVRLLYQPQTEGTPP